MTSLLTYRLPSIPLEQIADSAGYEWKLGAWWGGITYPTRLLALSRRFEMQPAIVRVERDIAVLRKLALAAEPVLRAVDAALRGEEGKEADPVYTFGQLDDGQQRALLDLFAGDRLLHRALGANTPALWSVVADELDALLWSLPWKQEMVRFYEALGRRHLRAASYLLLAWAPTDESAGAVQASLQSHFGRGVERLEQLPSLLSCAYTEQDSRLVPEQRGYPHLAVLHAYDARGTWDIGTLHTLLQAPFDVALAIDVQTPPKHRAQRAAEMAHTTARMLARDGTVKDARGERILHDADVVLHALTEQNLHDVAISALVSGETAEELEVNVADIASRLGSTLRLTRIAGVQGELLKFWSGTPTRALEAPVRTRNMLSHAVGCCAGVVTFHRASSTEGLLWGLDARRWAPLFLDLFGGAKNQAGHMVILGKTGAGKTWFLNQVTLRAAAIEGWRVIGIDAFRNGERIARAAGPGARCNWIGVQSAVNILDVVYDDETEGGWLPNQVQHVIGQLSLLLGQPGTTADGGQQLVPRAFSTDESGVLDRALSTLYANVDPDAPLTAMPILSDLIAVLEAQQIQEGLALARSLRLKLFGEELPERCTTLTTEGQLFNVPTTIDWDFSKPINYFDFSAVPERWRPFFYTQAIGAINRYMRDPRRDRRHKTLLIIDEFAYVTRVEAVARLAAEICKVARKYGIALLVVDQNPATFLDTTNGQYIFENTVAKILFHLDDAPARRMQSVISDIQDSHIDYLTHANPGECIAVFGNDVYAMIVETNPKETRAFAGS